MCLIGAVDVDGEKGYLVRFLFDQFRGVLMYPFRHVFPFLTRRFLREYNTKPGRKTRLYVTSMSISIIKNVGGYPGSNSHPVLIGLHFADYYYI